MSETPSVKEIKQKVTGRTHGIGFWSPRAYTQVSTVKTRVYT